MTQKDLADLFRVHFKTLAMWEKGVNPPPPVAVARVADAVERYFKSEGVKVTAADVSAPGLVEKIREQLEQSVAEAGGGQGETLSARSLRKLLDDETAVRILGIDGPMRDWLGEQAGNFRVDLTEQDWAEVVRLIKAGRWTEDGYLFMDPRVVTTSMHFKLPPGRLLTDRERWKIQKIAQEALDKLWKEKKEP